MGTSVLSHELGHCFGLFHTHSGRGCDDYINCAENANESNCLTCGDLICDTPADPCLSGNVNANCEYTGSTGFTPDVHNMMSYAPPTCLNHFTTEQFSRMHSTIMNTSALLARSFHPNISGPSTVCSSGATFTINLPPGATVTWSATSTQNNLSIDLSTGYAYATNSVLGTGTITAIIHTLCGDITLPGLNVNVGGPATPVISGPYGVHCDYQIPFSVTEQSSVAGITYSWASDILSIDGSDLPECTAWGTLNGNGYISCTVTACGVSKTGTRTIRVNSCLFLLFSPNPATNQTIVSIESAAQKDGIIPDGWDMEVYDASQLLKIKKVKLKDLSTTLNTADWKDGVYIVRAIIGDDIITEKLVVKH